MALTAIFTTVQQKFDIVVVRCDTFSRKLFQVTNADDEPADLTGYEFSIEVKKSPRATVPILTIPDANFLLGQSDAAIAFDVAEGNAAGTTKDEVHVNAPAELMRVQPGKWYYDIHIIDTGGDVISPMYGRFEIRNDVTRTNE